MSWPSGVKPDFGIWVNSGQMAGYSRASATGFNPDVDPDVSTNPEDAWGANGLFPWMDTLTSLEAVSTSPNDSAAGTGARTVSFNTLVGDYVAQSQVITMNGTTAVPIPVQGIANNGGICLTAGSLGTNDGDIILRDAGGGTIRGIILAKTGVMRQSPFTVPAGRTLFVPWLLLGLDSSTGAVGKFATIETWFKPLGGAAFSPLRIGNVNGSPYNHEVDPPIMVPQRGRFSPRIVSCSDNNAIVTAGWNGYLKVI